MSSDGIGPEIASAHVLVTASFAGMPAEVKKQASAAAKQLNASFTSSTPSAARDAGRKAGEAYSSGFGGAVKNTLLYGGAYQIFGTIESGFKEAAKAAIGFNAQLEQARVAYTRLLGSAQAADSYLSQLQKYARQTPYQFSDVLNMSQQLIGEGFSAQDSIKAMTAFGDAAASMGEPVTAASRALLMLGEAQAKGVIQQQQLTSIERDSRIPVLKILAGAYGETTAEMSKQIAAGDVLASDAIPKLLDAMEKGTDATEGYAGAMRRQSDTLTGTISNIKDALTQDIAAGSTGLFSTVESEAKGFYSYLNSAQARRSIAGLGRDFGDAAEGAVVLTSSIAHLWPEIKLAGEAWLAFKTASLIRGGATSLGNTLGSAAPMEAYRAATAEATVATTELAAAQTKLSTAEATLEAKSIVWEEMQVEAGYTAQQLATYYRGLMAAYEEVAVATTEATAAQQRYTLAIGTAPLRALSGLRAGAGSVISALGGPWGIALAGGAYELMQFATQSSGAKNATDSLTDAINAQTGALSRSGKKSLAEQLLGSYSVGDLAKAGYTVQQAVMALVKGGNAYIKLDNALQGTNGWKIGLEQDASVFGVGPLTMMGQQLKALKAIEDGYRNDATVAQAASVATKEYGSTAADSAKRVDGLVTSSAKLTALLSAVSSAATAAQKAEGPLGVVTTAISDKFWQGNKDAIAFAEALHIGQAQAGILGASLAKLPVKVTMEVVSNFDAQTLKALGLLHAVTELKEVANLRSVNAATAAGKYVNLGEAESAQKVLNGRKQLRDKLKQINDQYGHLVNSLGSDALDKSEGLSMPGSGAAKGKKPTQAQLWSQFLVALKNTPEKVPALFHAEGPQYYSAAYAHNKKFAIPSSDNYQTKLTAAQEKKFRAWVKTNHVPFDVNAKIVDYDMRGYWLATGGDTWKPGEHFPDTWKTPYDTTFSNESKYATKNNPFKWKGNNLIDTRNGQLVFGSITRTGLGLEQVSGKQLADFLIKGFGDELTKKGKVTVKGLQALGIEDWSATASKKLTSDFKSALKSTQSTIKSLKSEIKQGEQSMQSTWMSNFFSAQGSTDYFGNTIQGSTGAAALALAQANASQVGSAVIDENALNSALGPKYSDFLNSLLSSGNYGEISDLSQNTALAKQIGDAFNMSQLAAQALYDSSPAGQKAEAQLLAQQQLATQQKAIIQLLTTLAKIQTDEQIENKTARQKALAADTKIINGDLDAVGGTKISKLVG